MWPELLVHLGSDSMFSDRKLHADKCESLNYTHFFTGDGDRRISNPYPLPGYEHSLCG